MDSLIRLNQIYQPELSGYIASIINSLLTFNTSGDIIPSGSGIRNLGSETNYYKNLYVNGISVPSGSGITIGNSFFTAYTSGGAGIIQIDNYLITSSGDFVFIQGPQGIQGPSGATGVIGPTGIGIKEVSYDKEDYILNFTLSNGIQTGVSIPPLTGATGVSLVNFFQSGDLIYPIFNNFTTGLPIQLISGPQGEQGLPGTTLLYFNSGVGNLAGKLSQFDFPNSIQISDYYDSSSWPSISLMRGMSYTFDFSGLNTHIITNDDYNFLTGLLNNPFLASSKVGENSNYYSDALNGTGYWRIAFFDPSIQEGVYSGDFGSFGGNQGESSFYQTYQGKNEELYGDSLYTDTYRTRLTFNTKYTAKNHYKYGFVVYTVGEDGDQVLTKDLLEDSKSIAIIFGDVYVSSGVGPMGPIGPEGPEGPPGTGVGPKGDPGLGIKAINSGEFRIQFVFQDNSVSEWINLPQGGPAGEKGAPGSFLNSFLGEYSNSTLYKQNDTVSRNGSTYVYINQNTSLGNTPELNTNYWQLIAKSGQKGETGQIGPSGIADRYSSNLFVKSGFPIGISDFPINSTGITVNGINLSGTGAIFKTGDNVSFKNSGIIGYSYTPYQNIIFSSNSVSNSYFFGKVNSYNKNEGIINFFVESGGTGIINNTISGGYFLWYNYNNTTLNLGANLMSGSPGPQGPIGPQGPAGTPSLLRNTQIIYLKTGDVITLNPSVLDVFNITITGNGTAWGADRIIIDFDWNYFETGKCVLLKISNSGITHGNQDSPLFVFSGLSSGIRWPNNIYTRPDNNETYIYSILRFTDEDSKPACFGTYSNPYRYK